MSLGEAIGYIIGALLGLIICLICELVLKKKEIKKLQDRVNMYDFFYEGNGFKRRGLNNSIQIGNYIDELEKKNTKANEIIGELIQRFYDNEDLAALVITAEEYIHKEVKEK